jgi:hypothetical protein
MTHASTQGARPGERRGGRAKGTPNKRTLALRMGLAAAGSPSELATPPFKFLSDVMANEGNDLSVRIDAAKALLPYTNFRKGLVDTSGRDVPLQVSIVRFSNTADELENTDRLAKSGPVVIEHDPSPTSH